jgi:hypothetical protein
VKLSKTDAPNEKAIAGEYDVNEGAIKKVWDKQEQILERFALMFDEAKEKTFRSSVGCFIELEDMLYIWIDNTCRANLLVSPSLTIAKAKNIASSLSIPETNFKASWQWLSQFRVHRRLQKMLLHGEGVEVNKFDLGLLATLDDLYVIIAQYDPENVYNMDEIGLFFHLLSKYSLLMPHEDISTTRGKKKSKDRVCVCQRYGNSQNSLCIDRQTESICLYQGPPMAYSIFQSS